MCARPIRRRCAAFERAEQMAPPAFTGVWPIMATPFNDDETVDLVSFAKSISFMADAGCNGATITGVLGESNRLLDKEREALIKTAVAAAGDMPICVGTSHAGSIATRELSRMAEALGASAVMVTPTKEVTPLSDDKMVEFFAAVNRGEPASGPFVALAVLTSCTGRG